MNFSPRRNLYEQQTRNKQLTLVVMIVFVLFLAFLGFGFDLYMTGTLETNVFVPVGSLAAVALGIGSSFWSLRGGSQAVLRSTGALPLDKANPAHKQLENVVEEMSIASGLPRPQIFVIPDHDPNAFATGKDPQHSSIAVTQGLLESLNREELQGVVAHEMSHIRNYDIRLMTVVAALMGAVLLLSDWARRSLWYGGGRSRRRSSKSSGQLGLLLFALWLLGIILAPILGQMMAMAVSRKREYLADASAAELTRNPMGLANALRKLEQASEPTASIKRGAAHLCIVDPTGRRLNAKEGFVAELFGTHPPTEKRIVALQAMAYQYQNSPKPAA
ncbi:MAG: M48 family metallopeptidase [Ignavibacteriales bacterium]|nr:M48 family metallopeptidase [Ignavibacteriales bacterium]